MTWIIFFAYLVFFCWLVTVIPFFRDAGLSRKTISLLYLTKVIAGIAYFRFYSLPANKPTSDTWKFFNRSIPETNLLLHDPLTFFKQIFITKYASPGGLFSDNQSYWNDIKDELMVKLVAIVNVFTGNNYYANITWFNFFFFFGTVAFFRLMYGIYRRNKTALVFAVFLVPSFLFWCSGIHKDGLIFSMLGLIFFWFHRLLHQKNRLKYVLFITVALSLLFLLRNFIAIALVPCLASAVIMHLFPRRKLFVSVTVFIVGLAVIFGGRYLHPSLDIPGYIAGKQAQFKKLPGASAISTPLLDGTPGSLATALPSAVDVGFFRPHLNGQGMSSKIASAEIILVWAIFIYCIMRRKKDEPFPPVVFACWLFVLITLLVIGYTVHFSGAVVRYRAIALPLILGPAVAGYYGKYIMKKYI